MTPSEKAAKSTILPLIRGLVRSYQSFSEFDAAKLRPHNLTVAQADVIFTLGNTQGMTYKEIGQKTLTSKGTLTGIIERLADKQIVKKCANHNDGRSQIVTLTNKGNKLFQTVFPQHIKEHEMLLFKIDEPTRKQLTSNLQKLAEAFAQPLPKANKNTA